jgi:hypothetical protein
MMNPRFISVEYHEAYSYDKDNATDYFAPSMTALDQQGRVWRTFQLNDGGWAKWACINNFESV